MGVRGVLAAAAGLALLAAAGCSGGSSAHAAGKIVAVGAENEYADVISQIGGKYVEASSIMSNPSTDPHTFEANPKVAHTVSQAKLIVQNGLGYDDFMGKIEAASSGSGRKVITVQKLLGLPDSTPNPHLWYDPKTMPQVAKAIGDDLASLDPGHKSYFQANVKTFDASLSTWNQALAAFKTSYNGAPVATTEPVADYMLEAAGANNLTPFTFQANVMNGVDPSPQSVAQERGLFTGHKVKAFVYNTQVTDSLTTSLAALAKQNNVPVIGVYETMPTPGYHYQSWMVAEVQALTNAVAHGTSAPAL